MIICAEVRSWPRLVANATEPLGRLAEPEEIGRCVAFLASPLASYVR